MSGLYDTAPKEVLEARPIAIRFANEINNLCNKKFDHGGQMAILTASLVFQNLLTTAAFDLHGPPGSEKGEDWIRTMYTMALADAVARWHKRDLKQHHNDITNIMKNKGEQ